MFIILLIIILLIIIFYKNNNIIILDKYELLDVIINDYDNYYSTFNDLDLKVRNVKSIEEYKHKIKDSPVTISNHEKNILINTIKQIKNIFNNYSNIGFDGKKANNLKIIIGIINNKEYEEGFPHTRNNIIIIPQNLIFNKNLINVLIHEIVHIYQKIYLEDINFFLNTYNFKKNNIKLNTRANPDIDNFIYSNSNNELLYCNYNNNPTSIMDVIYYPINNEKYEHPYETMAYNIESDIKNNNLRKISHI